MSLTDNNPLVLTTFYRQISFQVKIDKHIFRLGETIHVEAEVENKGQETFEYSGSSTCFDTIYFSIQKKDETNRLIGEGSIHPGGCTRDKVTFFLNPNQKINESADFKTKTKTIDESEHEQLAELGEYILTAYYGIIELNIPIQIQ